MAGRTKKELLSGHRQKNTSLPALLLIFLKILYIQICPASNFPLLISGKLFSIDIYLNHPLYPLVLHR